jgi:CRP-like cAMP-binding protein/glyoxylase-like metal-dependent hydrolase (beta-lactamase superfamily II)
MTANVSQLLNLAVQSGLAQANLMPLAGFLRSDNPTPEEIGAARSYLTRLGTTLTDHNLQRPLLWAEQALARLSAADGSPASGAPDIPMALIQVTERGGVVYRGQPREDGKSRNIVLRAVPWVAKELFSYGGATIFVVAGANLPVGTGLPATDCEFPGYMGKFVRQEKAHLVLFEDEVAPIRRTLELSYLGATWNVQKSSLAQLYPRPEDAPDLHAEFKALESPFPLEGPKGVWEFHPMAPDSAVDVDGFQLRHLGKNKWRIFDHKVLVGDIDLDRIPVPSRETEFMESVLHDSSQDEARHMALVHGRPTWVSLGGGSGFTKEEASSHLLVDERGEATIVDPNINVVSDLSKLGISLHRVKRIHVTHVHFDHIAGLWQLIRHLPHKVELFVHANAGDVADLRAGKGGTGEMSTLKALFHMAENASDGVITAGQLLDAVDVVPIPFQTPMAMGTFEITFFHTHHSHPTTGYYLTNPRTGRPVLWFTGDSKMNVRDLLEAKVDDKPVMTPARVNFLANQVPMALLAGAHVFADAGVAPLHPTPQFYKQVEASLAAVGISGDRLKEIMGRLHVYHETESKVKAEGLNYVRWGWESAVDLSESLGWTPPRPEELEESLAERGVMDVPLLADMPARDLKRLMRLGVVKKYPRGSKLMQQGDEAQSMYVVLDGALRVTKELSDRKIDLGLLTSGLVGEGVLSNERTRNATVAAATDAWCLELGPKAVQFIGELGIATRMIELRELRRLVDGSTTTVPVLKDVSPATRDSILLRATTKRYTDGEAIILEGHSDSDLYILLEGRVSVTSNKGPLADKPVVLERGAVVGEGNVMAGGRKGRRSATVLAQGDVDVLKLSGRDLKRLLSEHGGDLHYFLLGLVQQRRRA